MSPKEDPFRDPDPETEAAAKPIEEELEKALSAIDSDEKAEAVIERLIQDTERIHGVEDIPNLHEDDPPSEQVEEAAEDVEQAAATATDEVDEAAKTIEAAAAEAATLKGESYEAVSKAIQDVTNPELQGHPEKLKRPRRLLLDAILRNPSINIISKIDTELFLLINVYSPRSPRLDRFYHRLSFVFTGGWIYLIAIALLWPFRPQWTWHILKRIALPTWAAALVVEGPIKKYFSRQRPFIDIVRAVVVGKKPGNWSFPSGHASAAFGGAYILGKYVPKLKPILYPIAALVAYSRVYLGAHYPGDVMTGSLIGVALARLTDWLVQRYWLKDKKR